MTTPASDLPAGYAFKPAWEVTPRAAAAQMKSDPTALLLDVRRPDEFERASVKGATAIPMDDIERRADELIADSGPAEELGKDRPILVMCHHGVRSMRVATTLKALGFTNVKSVAGGIAHWSTSVDASIPQY